MSEKVDGGNGKLYTRDHPHEIISPHVMRFAEIREWIHELSTNAEYGWYPGGRAGLSRALGFSFPDGMTHCLSTAWIWPKQQMRLTARIQEILAGYIVPTRFGTNRVDGVYTDPPKPPSILARARCVKIRALPGRLRYVVPDERPAMKLPSFSRAFAEAIFWDPNAKKGPRTRA
jgi:hypothetical protein